MGNCQAIDAATLVIQHPSGKAETMYWAVSASDVMKMNPGHYVALLITSTLYPSHANENQHPNNKITTTTNTTTTNNNSVRITRIKLLRPTDNLVLGQVYRLITTEEVMKSLWAKKHAKMKKNQSESSAGKSEQRVGSRVDTVSRRSDLQKTNQVTNKHEQQQKQRTTSSSSSTSTNPAISRSKMWQPSLKSISEATN